MAVANLVVSLLPPTLHVGDVGAVITARLAVADSPFDPTTADVHELIVSMPNGTTTLTATATPVGSPPAYLDLSYTVQGNEGPGSPPETLLQAAGPFQVQARLRISGSGSPSAEEQQWSSDVASVDDTGQELRVFPNLA